MRTTLVLGGPGCGKTTHLLNIVNRSIDEGTHPARIGFVAFTRKAAGEAKTRFMEKHDFDEDDLQYFSTLHSLAFRQLGINSSQVMDDDRFARFMDMEGYNLSTPDIDEFVLATPDDRALRAVHYSRLARLSLYDASVKFDTGYDRCERMRDAIEDFKEGLGLVDYTDMIEKFCSEGEAPDLELLIVDEAQDLSALQWEMVEKLRAPVNYYAGDDDQAIYEWAGADVSRFLNIEADEKIILPKSHRLRKNIFRECEKVSGAIHDRYYKDWSFSDIGGKVDWAQDISQLDLDSGNWLLLARNHYLTRGWVKWLTDEGVPFTAFEDGEYRSSLDNDHVRAILDWERLRSGRGVMGERLPNIYSRLTKDTLEEDSRGTVWEDDRKYTIDELPGLKARCPWTEAMNIPPSVRNHVRNARSRGENILRTPRVTVSTVHAAKGGEADHVAVCMDISKSCHRALNDIQPSSEMRVLYVAMSRAKESLHFVEPRTQFHYPPPDRVSHIDNLNISV